MPQPYKGVRVQQTVRLPADLHRAAIGRARTARWSVNDVIIAALEGYLSDVAVADPVGVRHNQNVYADDGTLISQ